MDWIREFFQALAELPAALWEFGDGMRGLLVTAGSVVLIALFSALAAYFRERQGWQSAVFGAMAALIGAWWLFGAIPAAWVGFVNEYDALLADRIIPAEIVTPALSIGPIHIPELEVATDFYNVVRDAVAAGLTLIGVAVLAFVALWVQKRYPRTLAPDEQPRPETGGRTDVDAARP